LRLILLRGVAAAPFLDYFGKPIALFWEQSRPARDDNAGETFFRGSICENNFELYSDPYSVLHFPDSVCVFGWNPRAGSGTSSLKPH
jgi:hypothetical protein